VVRLVLTGNLTELNTTLTAGVRYEVPDGNFNRLNYAIASATDGLVRLSVTINDQGHTGGDPANPAQPSPPLTGNATVTINVSPVNDPPTVAMPIAQIVAEDIALVFGAATSNAIVVTTWTCTKRPARCCR
jgi:hypothetical protein